MTNGNDIIWITTTDGDCPRLCDEQSCSSIYGGDMRLDGEETTIKVVLSYPLSHEVRRTITRDRPVNRGDLCAAVSRFYREIYEEEAVTSTIAETNLPGMLNRAPTNGVHGISMHCLKDLALEGIQKVGEEWHVLIGS